MVNCHLIKPRLAFINPQTLRFIPVTDVFVILLQVKIVQGLFNLFSRNDGLVRYVF